MDANWLLNAIAPDTADTGNTTDERLKQLSDQGVAMSGSTMADQVAGMPSNPYNKLSWLNVLGQLAKNVEGNVLTSQAQHQRGQVAGKSARGDAAVTQNFNPANALSGSNPGDIPSSGGVSSNDSSPILAALSKAGMTPYDKELIQTESGFNPKAQNAGHRGLDQLSPQEEAKYGINDSNWQDPIAQLNALHKKEADDTAQFQQIQHRAPTPAEQYAVHQRGIGGAVNEVNNPDANKGSQ